MNKSEIKDKIELVKKDYDIIFQKFARNGILKYFDQLPEYISKIFFGLFKVSYFIPIYVMDKIVTSIQLQRDYLPKNIKKVNLPPELQTDYLITNESDNIDKQIKESITKFIELLHREVPSELLGFFYRNLSSLDINNLNPLQDTGVLGLYDVKDNTISVIDKTDESTIFHELFHMASSYVDSKTKTNYCGFDQKNIGRGINEGYTQLLTERYAEDNSYCYVYQTRVAKIVEKAVGKDKMLANYFSANLKGLIDELSKYKNEQEIIKFIQYLDFYTKYNSDKSLLPTKAQKLIGCEQYIADFLRDIMLKNLKLNVDSLFLTNSRVTYDSIEREVLGISQELYFLDPSYHNEQYSFNSTDKILHSIGYQREYDGYDTIIVNKNENYQMEEDFLNNAR